MSRKKAIEVLRDALRVADLPENQVLADEGVGRFLRGSPNSKLGYMEACIKQALKELGFKVAS
jgi:hypothetical protein